MQKEYKGHEYEVVREESENSGYKYELWLYIDGKKVRSATELEKRGYDWDDSESWSFYLHRYARAYIDGMEAGV